MLEESEQQAASQPRGATGNLPYQARTSPMHSSDRQRPTEGDGVNQFQEQLGRFAESMWELVFRKDSTDMCLAGKKTFNTFLSKVRAKIQEFDSPSGYIVHHFSCSSCT
jgi:hypothetical protein